MTHVSLPFFASAGPALRGFRLQMLYTLSRLVEPPTTLVASLQPEGVEDLAVYDAEGRLVQAVQVKALGAPLTLADLEPKSPRGLLRRVLDARRGNPVLRSRLVSFGPIGNELARAWGEPGSERRRVQGKLRQAGFSQGEIDDLFMHLSFEQVQEKAISDRIGGFFRSIPLLVGETEHAAELVCHWLYGTAEHSECVRHADLITRLQAIGRYLQERAAHWQEWLTSIRPLDTELPEGTDRDRLAEGFRLGMAADHRHILAGCDVPRRQWLERIDRAFDEAPVVVLRGASGQGKSALAYRWLQDRTPGLWRFQVQLVQDRRHALAIATALSGHARAIGAPLTVYLDVRPGDRAWPELVRELSRLPLVRVLVTVREENWRRASLPGAEIEFRDVALQLGHSEAQEIYRAMERCEGPLRFLSFDEAWRRFGGGGPLLEFIHLLTRSETLHDCLAQQIAALRDEVRRGKLGRGELELLALTAVASDLGARIDLAELRRHLHLPDPGRSIERLEREYLVRLVNGGLCLDGLHPLRSRVLADLLCDGVTFDILELVIKCLVLVPAQDLEPLLLSLAVHHPTLLPDVEDVLRQWSPTSWAVIGGIFHFLLWLGVRRYIDRCTPLIHEARAIAGSGWWIALDFDLADLIPGTGTAVWREVEFFPGQQRRRFQELVDRQPPKAEVYQSARDWLGRLSEQPIVPGLEADWEAIAELSYWCGRLRIDSPAVVWLAQIFPNEAVDSLSLPLLARVLLGIYEMRGAAIVEALETIRPRIAARFRQQTDTVWIEKTDGTVSAHFLVGWSREEESSLPMSEGTESEPRGFNAEAMDRVTLLRGLYPDRRGFSCQGYGHRVLSLAHDDTTKSGIDPGYLPPIWPTRLNGTATALAQWDDRPEDWDTYLDLLWTRRVKITRALGELRRALIAHFRDRHKRRVLGNRMDTRVWDELRDSLSTDIALPKEAVDPWGFVSETQDQTATEGPRPRAQVANLAVAPYRRLLKVQHEVFSALLNFANQALPYLFLDYRGSEFEKASLQAIEKYLDSQEKRLVEQRVVMQNLLNFATALPKWHKELYRVFSSRAGIVDLPQREQREQQLAVTLLALWQAYREQPGAQWVNPAAHAAGLWNLPVHEVLIRIERGLNAWSDEGIKGRVLSKDLEWQGETAPWLRIDTPEPLEVFSLPGRVRALLADAVGTVSIDSRKRLALEQRWHSVVVVPLIRGRSLARWAWVTPMYRFTTSLVDSQFAWVDDAPRPLDDQVWMAIGIEEWQDPGVRAVADLLPTISHMHALMAHFKDWLPLAKREGADISVVQAFADRHSDEWSRCLQNLIDALNGTTRRFNALPEDQQSARDHLLLAVLAIDEHRPYWIPSGVEAGQVALSVQDLDVWLREWEGHVDTLHEVYAHLLLDAFMQVESPAV